MPDIADNASDTIELELRARISAVRKHTGPQLAAIGVCHNCEADLAPGKLFCSPLAEGPGMSECQQDYERRVRRVS
jgi:hypothetical protein